jgi:hypothetical protein
MQLFFTFEQRRIILVNSTPTSKFHIDQYVVEKMNKLKTLQIGQLLFLN